MATELRRALTTRGAAAFVITNMIGTGIFTVPAFVRTATGSGLGSLGVWVIGALLALSGALCYAELATRMPEAGGEYYYLSRIFGRLWGFVSGWISFFVGFSSAIAASSLGAAAYAAAVFPQWHPGRVLLSFAQVNITEGSLAAASLIALLSAFHATGVRPSGRLQTVIAGLVVIAILAFVALGIISGHGSWSGVTFSSGSQGSWWVALIQVGFAYTGWNAAAYLAGEVKEPRHTLPRALIGGTFLVAVIYLALNVLFLYVLPVEAWQPSIGIGRVVAERLFGTAGATAVSGLITLIILGSASAMVAAGPRVYYAMSRDRLAPAVVGKLGKRGAPVVAILVQALVAMALALTGAFEALLIYAGSALSLMAGLTVAGLWLIPRNKDGAFRVPGYPITPAVFLSVTLFAFIQGLKERPVPTGAALVTIVIGVIIFYLARVFGWFSDAPLPEENAAD